jgi:hypothetical protein
MKFITPILEEKLSNNQSGFRKRRSCIDQIKILHSQITHRFSHSYALPVIFLDISKAFDRVNHIVLLHKAKGIGLDDQLLAYTYSFLSNRQLRVIDKIAVSPWFSTN